MGEHKLDRVKSHGWHDEGPMSLPGTPVIAKRYTKGECRVLITLEPQQRKGAPKLHLSISCADRYPTWEEIKDARYSLLPMGLTFAQILPPLHEFVNVHPNCFHLWEIPGDN